MRTALREVATILDLTQDLLRKVKGINLGLMIGYAGLGRLEVVQIRFKPTKQGNLWLITITNKVVYARNIV